MFSFKAILICFLNPGEVSYFRQAPKLMVLFYVAVQNASVPKVASRIKISSPLTPKQDTSA